MNANGHLQFMRSRCAAIVGSFSLGIAIAVAPGIAAGQSGDAFPSRPITIIIPFAAGGGADIGARILAADLEKELGSTVVVANREGAGGQTGLTVVAQSKPDGYTIGGFNMPATNTVLLSPERKAAFTLDSFEPLINHVVEPIVIGVRSDSPYKTLKDLVDDLKKKPNEVRVATSGLLTPEHLAALQLEQAVPTKLRIAHFGGAAGSLTEFRAGRADILFTTPSLLGEIKPLAVLTPERVSLIPNIPTAAEQGFPSLVMTSSRGFVVPKGVPPATLAKLRQALVKATSTDAHKAKMKERSLNLQVISGEDYEKYIRQVHGDATKLIQLAKDRP